MSDERNEGPPPEYAEGRVCHFTTLSRVNEPLAAHLSPDYVRGLVDVPDSEADLLAEWRAARARGETGYATSTIRTTRLSRRILVWPTA